MVDEMQKRLWGILIENELYKLLEFARDDKERQQFIEEFSTRNNIPIDFVKEKIDRINKNMNRIKDKEQEER